MKKRIFYRRALRRSVRDQLCYCAHCGRKPIFWAEKKNSLSRWPLLLPLNPTPQISSLIQSQPMTSSRLKSSCFRRGRSRRSCPSLKPCRRISELFERLFLPKKVPACPPRRGTDRYPHPRCPPQSKEAQANIGQAVQELINQKESGPRGAGRRFHEPMDFSWYRRYPYQDSVKAVADYLAKRDKRIFGSECIPPLRASRIFLPSSALTKKHHYDANVKARINRRSALGEFLLPL